MYGGNDSLVQRLEPLLHNANRFGERSFNPGHQACGNNRNALTSLAKQKILIVDDELWAALDMEWVVQTLGHEAVGPVATADKAIELAGTMRPNLVLMDIRLANNGDGVAEPLK